MRITKLDGLRGIFSLMVVFFHYPLGFIPDGIYDSFMIRESYTFVDFFFVLSGFVITYNYNNLSSFSEFWVYMKKRFIRLYPLLFYTVSIYFVVFLIAHIHFPEVLRTLYTTKQLILRAIDSLLFTNSTPILGSTPGLNTPSWSISSEMISYTVFGILTIFFIGKRKNVLLILLILASLVFSYIKKDFFAEGDYGFVRGLVSFNLGYFVWYFSQKKFVLHNIFECFVPIMLPLLFFQLNRLPDYSDEGLLFGMIAVPLFFSFSILILLKTNGLLSKILETRSLQYLVAISYSLYLNHYFIVFAMPKGLFSVLKIENTNLSSMIVFVLVVVIIIIYSHFTYKYIERKGGKLLKGMLFK